jgi:hypothetical protein
MKTQTRWILVAVPLAMLLAGSGCGTDSVSNYDAGEDMPYEVEGVMPCSQYTDADGDTIPDSIEGNGDPDGDTIPNMYDDDSDGDGIPDAVEAGDSDLCTIPANTDVDPSVEGSGDSRPDFLDPDSDNDGLSDADEVALGTDPRRKDSDGDGVTDLGEVAAETDPLDPLSTISPDDFFVILPFLEPEQHRDLDFGTTLKIADVYFFIDTTGSMDSAIINVASSLTSTIIPSIAARIPDVQVGVGHFNDFPTMPYGDFSDMPYWHDVDITDNISLVQAAIDTYPNSSMWGSGYDTPESNIIAMYLTASGNGLNAGGASIPPRVCPGVADEPGTRVGYPCFRPMALPILVHISDAPWHNGPAPVQYPYDFATYGYTDALAAMNNIGARHVGVFVNNYGTEGLTYMEAACRETGTVDSYGSPLVVVSDTGAVDENVVTMIETLATSTPQDVNAVPEDYRDDPGPGPMDFDATQFIIVPITPKAAYPPDGYPPPTMDNEFFYDVVPGTQVTFDVTFYNGVVPPGESAQVFKAWIVVLGNRVTELDRRLVIIIVPTEGMGDIII